MDNKEEVLALLTMLLEGSKNYELLTRNFFTKLREFEKKDLEILYAHDKDIRAVLDEYEIVYKRIQEEI